MNYRRLLNTVILASIVGGTSVGADGGASPPAASTAAPTETTPPEVPTRHEVVVVTASRLEQELTDAPATMSVISGDAIRVAPAQNYGDLLRGLPGVNVIQMSARDINVASRVATGTLENSQLGLLDGRSINLELFGVILWDLVPVEPSDIKQIEVVRGPASAVWGSNALTGAVNIITKTPREAPGGTATLTGGLFSRDAGTTAGRGPGGAYGLTLGFARAPSDEWSYRISSGLSHSDALARPAGTIPVGRHPVDPTLETGGGSYPPYANVGTTQPKLDVRVDQDPEPDLHLTYSGGIAATTGTFHTGIGPFELKPGSLMGYGRVAMTKGNLKISAFSNLLDATAPNLLLADPRTGEALPGVFKTQTYDLEVGDSYVLGQYQVLSFGGNLRRNNFDISIAEKPENRNEIGTYIQDQVLYGRWRFTLGARLDKFSVIDGIVFSPRLAAVLKVTPDQSLRLSFNRAFRSPSVINDSVHIETVTPADLSGIAPLLPPALQPAVASPFPLLTQIVGNRALEPESLTAYEISYTGRFGHRTTLSAAYYIDDRKDSINFVTLPPDARPYTEQNPPPGFPLPPSILTALAGANIFLPEVAATYSNLGPLRERGLELGLEHQFHPGLGVFANYSWQAVPRPRTSTHPYPSDEISVPPTNRVNAGVNFRQGKLFGTASVNYSDGAFWPDVLTDEFHGRTPAFTMLNATLGLRLNDRLTASVKGTNLTNDDVQQHIFGDILKRGVAMELQGTF